MYTGFTLPVCPSVRLSVYGQNRVRCASSPILFTHLINELQKVCRMLSFVKNSKIWILSILLSCTFYFILCYCNVNVDSWFLIRVVIAATFIFHDDTSRWFRVWSKLQFCIFDIFFQLYLVSLCDNIKDKVDSFLLQSVTLNGRKFDMLMYSDNLKNWLDFGHRLFIFPNLAAFWLSETDQICLKFGMLMYSDHLQNRLDFGHGMLIFLNWVPFWLSETGQICGFRDFL